MFKTIINPEMNLEVTPQDQSICLTDEKLTKAVTATSINRVAFKNNRFHSTVRWLTLIIAVEQTSGIQVTNTGLGHCKKAITNLACQMTNLFNQLPLLTEPSEYLARLKPTWFRLGYEERGTASFFNGDCRAIAYFSKILYNDQRAIVREYQSSARHKLTRPLTFANHPDVVSWDWNVAYSHATQPTPFKVGTNGYVHDLTDDGDVESNPGPGNYGQRGEGQVPPSSGSSPAIGVHPAFIPGIVNDVVPLGGVSVTPSQLPYCTPLGQVAHGLFAPSFITGALKEQQRDWDLRFMNHTQPQLSMPDDLKCVTYTRSVCVERFMRDKAYELHRMPYYVAVCHQQNPSTMGHRESSPTCSMPTWSVKFAALQDLNIPTREKKYLMPAIGNERYCNEASITTEWRSLYRAAAIGGCYVKFFTKLWLDFITQSVVRDARAKGGHVSVSESNSIATWTMVSSMKLKEGYPEDYAHQPDMNFVSSKIGDLCRGKAFLVSNDFNSMGRSHASMVQRYASSWPRERVAIGNTIVCATNIQVSGATHVYELVGAEMAIESPGVRGPPNPHSIIAFAYAFAEATNSGGDMMAGWELATANGLQTNVGTFSDSKPLVGRTTDAFWCYGGYSLPNDRTLPAYFQPLCEVPTLGKASLQLMAMQPELLFNTMLSHHVWTSVSMQMVVHGNNLTKEVLCHTDGAGGITTRVLEDLTRMQRGEMRVSNIMLAQAAQMLWLYGFKPRKQVMQAISHQKNIIGPTSLVADITGDMAMPMLWTGWEILEVAMNIPDSHVPPMPDFTIKQNVEGGLSWGTKREDRNQVRLSRSMPVIRDYPWLLDGGIDYSMRFYAMDLDGTRTFWHKPNVTTRPHDTPDLPILMANGVGWGSMPFRFPRLGQCPSFDSTENEQLSWMFSWDDASQYEWARMITHQQKNVTSTLKFRFPAGSNSYDENAIMRVFPELMADLNCAYVPEIDMSAVYNVSFGVAGDAQLGSSSPGNDPRFDAAFRWVKVGKTSSRGAENIPRHKKDPRLLGERALDQNMYSALPMTDESKEDVVRESAGRGTTITSRALNGIPAQSKPLMSAKQRARQAETDENAAIDSAIRMSEKEAEAAPRQEINSARAGGGLGEARVSWAERSKVKNDDELLRTREGLHQEKLASQQRAGNITRATRGSALEAKAEDDQLPIHYKTDNDETRRLQDELELRKGSQRRLN